MIKPDKFTDEEWKLRITVLKLEARYNKTIELHERKLDKLRKEIRALCKTCEHRLTSYHPMQYDSFTDCDICNKMNPKQLDKWKEQLAI